MVALLAGPVAPALAGSYAAKFVVGQRTYEAGGKTGRMDVAPFVEGGRVFVPVRFLAYAVGVPESGASWDNASRTARLEGKGIRVTLQVGSRVLQRNGSPVQMDVAPVFRNGRIFLPARYVAEAFGYSAVWDRQSRSVFIYPAGISWEAVKRGTLQPPEGAKSPPDKWGFAPKAVYAEFKVGSRHATVTRVDGSTYRLDLGTPCVVVGNPVGIEFLRKQYPGIYNSTNSIPLPGMNTGAIYFPFIPVAEAFGVPRENIVWDGKHLVVFGWDAVDGYRGGYKAYREGSREGLAKWHNGEVTMGKSVLDFPLFVKDGVPMVGTSSVCDFAGIVFRSHGGYCAIVNIWHDHTRGGWSDETGTVGTAGKP